MTARSFGVRGGLLLAACAVLPGCANFSGTARFAESTAQLSQTMRSEFRAIDVLCVQQAELVIVVVDAADEGPLKDCDGHRAAQGRLAEVTLDVLDATATALAALADDRAFDLRPQLKGIGRSLAGLEGRDGKALLAGREASALRRVTDLLGKVAATGTRKDAVQHLTAAQPDLAVTADVLRRFFVGDPAAGSAAGAPYANLLALTSASMNSTARALDSPALRKAEPLRAVELQRALRTRRAQVAARTGTAPTAVPQRIAVALDAWRAALDTFAADPFAHDGALGDRLIALREATFAAQQAIVAPLPVGAASPG